MAAGASRAVRQRIRHCEPRETPAVRILSSGVTDRTYLHGPRGPEYERVGANAPVWYLYDGLGSVLGTVDGAGNLVSTRKYDVYGAVRASTGPSGTKHRFVGGLGHPSEDDTGLIYMRARYMDPVTGRFVSEDPARDGQNWFTYANSSPINWMDFDGKVPISDIIARYIKAELALHEALRRRGGYGDSLKLDEQVFDVIERVLGQEADVLRAIDDVDTALEYLRGKREIQQALGRCRGIAISGQKSDRLKNEVEALVTQILGVFGL